MRMHETMHTLSHTRIPPSPPAPTPTLTPDSAGRSAAAAVAAVAMRRRDRSAAAPEDSETKRRREAEGALRARLGIRPADGFYLSSEKVCWCAYSRRREGGGEKREQARGNRHIP